jgi:predicted metal-dependent hydrolase
MEELKVIYQRRKSGKRASISLSRIGEVIVKFPPRVPLFLAKLFFQKYKPSIERMRVYQKKKGEELIRDYGLDSRLLRTHSGEELKLYKEQALVFVLKKIPQIAEDLSVQFQKVRIKNTKTRWGSCSSKGNLNFHYKILFLPEAISRYLIVHELCHLKEMNHSRAFWTLVETVCPEYEKLRKDLRSLSP